MEDFFSFYGLTTVFLGLIWSLIFSLHEELRREQLILGLLAVFLMPFFFIAQSLDATTLALDFSQLTAIDLGFAFFLSGIAGTIFHATVGRNYHHLPTIERYPFGKNGKITQLWIARLFVMFLLYLWAMVFLVVGLGVTAPYATIVCAVLFVLYFITHRHDLLIDSIWSGFLTTFVVVLAGTIAASVTEVEYVISPIRSHDLVLGVPFDLLLWAIACGLALGPIYEFIRNIKIK
jgi:hypothetical protein